MSGSIDCPAAIISGEKIRNPTATVLRRLSPRMRTQPLVEVPTCDQQLVGRAAIAAEDAARDWKNSNSRSRAGTLESMADHVEQNIEHWSQWIAEEIGKPIRDAQAEVRYGVKLVRCAAQDVESTAQLHHGETWTCRSCPHGVVGVITPWNNPLAIPLGKIAPALLYGNAVVWKPAPAGSVIAIQLMNVMEESGLPTGLVNLVCGDRHTAAALMRDPHVAAVTMTGSASAGADGRMTCARRGIPFQGEFGGNNPSIVWSDGDLDHAAQQIALAAFGSAGQRCTANRRAVVDRDCYDEFVLRLIQKTKSLNWGDPLLDTTEVGPVVSQSSWQRVADAVELARSCGATIHVPHKDSDGCFADESGFYYPPTIVCCDHPEMDIVQQETFGPVLVVQQADSWPHALSLANGVRQGLVASLFSRSTIRKREFLATAQAGVLKLNAATAGLDADAPFAGWKESGIGPPKHGHGDRQFFTRTQTVYPG